MYVQNHTPIAPADCHVKIEHFVHVSWWHINYRSYIHNWVTYITKSHSPLWHICCCIACILRLLYITTWQMIYVTCIWKLHSWQFILLHTYLGFIYHKSTEHSYISFAFVSCFLTSTTVLYITMLWMKPLRFCGVIYITIYWHTFSIYIIYHGNKAVCISWIDAKKLAHNSCKPVQDCYVNNNINLAQNRPKIMEKTCWPPKKYTCLKSCSDCSCRQSCKNWMFCSCELMTHQLQKLHT